MNLVLEHERVALFQADCLDMLRALPDDSLDSLVTDPPAGIGFMGKDWDRHKGGRDQWIAWLEAIMRECYRVLKPGAHGLVWALPRTAHWTTTAVENAGFEIRDVVLHLFGTGFPKSLNVSKAIDAALGVSRDVVGHVDQACGVFAHSGSGTPQDVEKYAERDVTAATSDEAKAWDGWGTALKPAAEHWVLCRKPLAGTVASNVLEHGTGALNIDGCRIGDVDTRSPTGTRNSEGWGTKPGAIAGSEHGRYPANVTLDEDAAQVLDAQSGTLKSGTLKAEHIIADRVGQLSKGDEKGRTFKPRWGDSGGASRFFYVAKGSRKEKDAGLDHIAPKTAGEATDRADGSDGLKSPRAGAGRTGGARNTHPTVKSIALMTWLIRLVTPPQGTVLDPFAGSGTTGVAALAEGCSFVGCELSEEYAAIAHGRLTHALAK